MQFSPSSFTATTFLYLIKYAAEIHKLASSSFAEPVYLISKAYEFK